MLDAHVFQLLQELLSSVIAKNFIRTFKSKEKLGLQIISS